jgi:hypothetical protein
VGTKHLEYLSLVKGQKTCFDPINLEEGEIEQYLTEDGHIILTDLKVKQLICSTVDYLRSLLTDPNHIYFSCLGRGQIDRTHPFVRLDVGAITYYVTSTDLRAALKHQKEWKLMTFEDTKTQTVPLMSASVSFGGTMVSGWHCQEHTRRPLSTIITFDIMEQKSHYQQSIQETTKSTSAASGITEGSK